MIQVQRREDFFCGTFEAMKSPCEVFVDCDDQQLAEHLTELAREEALRIEHKFSRYRDDNIVHEINQAGGRPIAVDDETALLLDFAQQCFQLSEGRFDVTSGVLRACWRFDGSDHFPAREQIDALLPLIGWQQVRWQDQILALPAGMEIDFGGIGKEYAVDRATLVLAEAADCPVLLNFGGDLHVGAPRRDGRPWVVGLEDPRHERTASGRIEIRRGALATSGDSRRYLTHNGQRYSHILDPTTGYPVANGPASVTVAANSCIEAGILSTLAMLYGSKAEAFLQAQEVRYWCQWDMAD